MVPSALTTPVRNEHGLRLELRLGYQRLLYFTATGCRLGLAFAQPRPTGMGPYMGWTEVWRGAAPSSTSFS